MGNYSQELSSFQKERSTQRKEGKKTEYELLPDIFWEKRTVTGFVAINHRATELQEWQPILQDTPLGTRLLANKIWERSGYMPYLLSPGQAGLYTPIIQTFGFLPQLLYWTLSTQWTKSKIYCCFTCYFLISDFKLLNTYYSTNNLLPLCGMKAGELNPLLFPLINEFSNCWTCFSFFFF